MPGAVSTAGVDLEFSGSSVHKLSTNNALSFADLTLLNAGGSLVASGSGLLYFGEIILPDENPADIGSELQTSLPITYNPTDPANAYLRDAKYALSGGGSLSPGVIATGIAWNNTGAAGASDGQTWDIASNINWNNGAPAVYADGANVTFNDNNNGNYNVLLNMTVNPGSVTVNSTGNYVISGTGTIGGTGSLTKSGAGTLTLSTPNTYSGGTTVIAGRLVIEPTSSTTSALPTGALAVSGNGIVQLSDNVTLTSLSLTGNGILDIGNNRIIIDYSSSATDPIASIAAWIKNGYYGVVGPQIVSSDITADDAASGLSYGICYADGADGVVAGLPSGEIEIMFTLLGDANLDGTVNSEDFTPFSHNLGQSGSWDDGDFNYDGTVNAEDFTAFSHNLNQSAILASGLDLANGIRLIDVPEPACTGMMVMVGLGILSRRRRRARHPA
jgi:autotransporter-associated beta strand protein